MNDTTEIRAQLETEAVKIHAEAVKIQIFSDELDALCARRAELLDRLSEYLTQPFIFPETFQDPTRS